MQPFSPALFGHGPPPGPHILNGVLRGEVDPDKVEEAFDCLGEASGSGSAVETDVL